MTMNAASLDAGIADLETKLANLKRDRAGLSASATGGLSASQRDSSEYLTLKARGIEVTDASGKLNPIVTIHASIDAKYSSMNPDERDRALVERIKLKRMAERLTMGLG